MIPLYGFLQGDTIGLLVLAEESETLGSLCERLKNSASVRVAYRENGVVLVNDQPLPMNMTVDHAGLGPLDRFDVRWDEL